MTDDRVSELVHLLREAVINTIGLETEDPGGASWHHHEKQSWDVVREKLAELLSADK